jgi:hypothetical protein
MIFWNIFDSRKFDYNFIIGYLRVFCMTIDGGIFDNITNYI